MSLFNFFSSMIGGNTAKKAYSGAANAYITKAGEGLNVLGTQMADSAGRVDGAAAGIGSAIEGLAPAQTAGNDATASIRALLGLDGPEAQAAALGGLQNSPLLESLNRNGSNLALANASATGGIRGGNINRSLAELGTDNFASVIQQMLGNLGGVADRGLSAGQSILQGRENIGGLQLGYTGQTLQNAGAQTDLLNIQGGAKANGILGRNTATQKQITAGTDLVQQLASAFAGPGTALGGTSIGGSTLGQFI